MKKSSNKKNKRFLILQDNKLNKKKIINKAKNKKLKQFWLNKLTQRKKN